MTKPKCKCCGKVITGIVKIKSHQKRMGKKLVQVVDYYDEDCFKKITKEKALNEHRKQKRIR